jgi:hypothetical protein
LSKNLHAPHAKDTFIKHVLKQMFANFVFKKMIKEGIIIEQIKKYSTMSENLKIYNFLSLKTKQ